jgi:hypothetical protein
MPTGLLVLVVRVVEVIHALLPHVTHVEYPNLVAVAHQQEEVASSAKRF